MRHEYRREGGVEAAGVVVSRFMAKRVASVPGVRVPSARARVAEEGTPPMTGAPVRVAGRSSAPSRALRTSLLITWRKARSIAAAFLSLSPDLAYCTSMAAGSCWSVTFILYVPGSEAGAGRHG